MTENRLDNVKLAYSVEEFAACVSIGRTLAWELIRSGHIKVVRINRRVIVPKASIEKFLEITEIEASD